MVEEIASRVQREILASFCQQVFSKLGVTEKDATITADVLVTADLRGVASHGVAHLRRVEVLVSVVRDSLSRIE